MGAGLQRAATIAALVAGATLGIAASAAASTATYTDADGHTIDVVAPSMGDDPVRDRLFVDLLGTLVHGPEMDLLTVQLAANEVEHDAQCGGAAGCYTPHLNTLYMRGFDPGPNINDPADDLPLTSPTQLPRGLLAHEYGHHVANHRKNPPFEGDALANGTKRWATYMRICPRLAAGELGTTYQSSPGENFAESYRALNFPENLGFWFLDPSLKPDQTALGLIREDVLSPWEGPTTKKLRGKFVAGGKAKAKEAIELPLDGDLSASLKTSGSLKAKLSLVDGAKKLAKGKGAKQKLDYEVCGTREVTAVVKRVSGDGRFKVTALRP